MFFVHMFACKNENVKFLISVFRVIVSVTPIERPQGDKKNETFPDSEV